MRPTREQIESARERIQWLLDQGLFSDITRTALECAVALMEPPDELTVRREGRAFLEEKGPLGDLDIYVAGAMRDGAK